MFSTQLPFTLGMIGYPPCCQVGWEFNSSPGLCEASVARSSGCLFTTSTCFPLTLWTGVGARPYYDQVEMKSQFPSQPSLAPPWQEVRAPHCSLSRPEVLAPTWPSLVWVGLLYFLWCLLRWSSSCFLSGLLPFWFWAGERAGLCGAFSPSAPVSVAGFPASAPNLGYMNWKATSGTPHSVVPWVLASLACLPSRYLSKSSYVCFIYNIQPSHLHLAEDLLCRQVSLIFLSSSKHIQTRDSSK